MRVVLSLWFCLSPRFGAPPAKAASCLPHVWTNNTLPYRTSVWWGGSCVSQAEQSVHVSCEMSAIGNIERRPWQFPMKVQPFAPRGWSGKQNWRSSYSCCIVSGRRLLWSMLNANSTCSHWPLLSTPIPTTLAHGEGKRSRFRGDVGAPKGVNPWTSRQVGEVAHLGAVALCWNISFSSATTHRIINKNLFCSFGCLNRTLSLLFWKIMVSVLHKPGNKPLLIPFPPSQLF